MPETSAYCWTWSPTGSSCTAADLGPHRGLWSPPTSGRITSIYSLSGASTEFSPPGSRHPRHARIDVFAPTLVVWAYEGAPQPALQALLGLVAPHHPQAPTSAYPAPAGLRIPRAEQRPMTIQLPPPHRIGHRATRLTTRTDRQHQSAEPSALGPDPSPRTLSGRENGLTRGGLAEIRLRTRD